jgi:hypothetical protein
MNSYKTWQTLNESFFPGMTLGLAHPQSLGLQSNLPGISLSEKKKMSGDVFVDDGDGDEDDCSCKHKKGKGKKKHHEPDGDEAELKFSKKNMKKKMKKHMDDDVEEIDHDDHDDDDVNDVDVPDDHDDHDDDHDDHDDHDDDVEDHDDDHDDHDDDDHDDDVESHDDGDGDDDHHDDDGEDAPKFGFMKDKKKKSKKQRKDEAAFWEDINANYGVPKNEIGTDEEFFDSLARQYGDPHVRFSGGVDRVDEDLLLSPDQQALIDAMPKPGEVGYAPTQRVGGAFFASQQPDLDSFDYGESTEYDEDDSNDFEVLCKYFSESVAYDLIQKRKAARGDY